MTTETTALDEKIARQTGASVEQLRKEREEFEKMQKEGKAPAKPKKEAKAKAKAKVKAKKKAAKKSEGGGIKALETAKVRYKKQGDVTNCGDWLAKLLKEEYYDKKEGFDYDGFAKCCKDNGLDLTEKWATNKNAGWQGRFRMNGRQKLEIVIAREGVIKVKGKPIKPTGVFLKAMQDRHEFDEDADD